MQPAQTGKVGRVVPTRRAGQEGKEEADWLVNGGSPHAGALGTARPTNTANTFGARRFVGPEGHAHHSTTNNKTTIESK